MKHAIYQMDVIVGKPEQNREKVANWMEGLANVDEIDTIVLPEMWNAGYALDQLEALADDHGKQTIEFLSELAKKYDVNIIGGSVANRVNHEIYNSSFIVNQFGELVYKYDKIHLVPMLDEPRYLTGGKQKDKVFELNGTKMGVIICYDLRFPEIIRSLILQGAEVIYIVAQWPSSRKDHWKILQQARAIENQCYIISANSCGRCYNTQFAGESLIVEPSGEIVAKGVTEKEATIFAEIDLDIVKNTRNQIPIFTSRVPHLYNSES
ncbi:Carbon-nitrogen hydrolase [Gracilibacillus ureilyticus]|uniref:Carbon-nitrogen hydrolase n=1 Tax=Gracilibacillus ureilyticus TaxID=531814 RepID=A0A1H9UTQ5_9BACI|nr:carbon-nitrogen family hydrolase [Gracilibacillus ureilyticus]SES12709.1 Carbon-nitrogen hydrolase [Gracilibacillus ureilyticus]